MPITARSTSFTVWIALSKGIESSGNFDRVDNVRKNVTNDEQLDKLDQCCGEAYFARALAYSELVKLFCKAYESDEDAANQLGVILLVQLDRRYLPLSMTLVEYLIASSQFFIYKDTRARKA